MMAINWTTFATLYSALITPIIAQLQSMLGNSAQLCSQWHLP